MPAMSHHVRAAEVTELTRARDIVGCEGESVADEATGVGSARGGGNRDVDARVALEREGERCSQEQGSGRMAEEDVRGQACGEERAPITPGERRTGGEARAPHLAVEVASPEALRRNVRVAHGERRVPELSRERDEAHEAVSQSPQAAGRGIHTTARLLNLPMSGVRMGRIGDLASATPPPRASSR